MSPDDERHGTARGRSQHMRDGEKPCGPCAWAHSRENKRRNLAANTSPKVLSIGSQRRIRALQAIGYGKRRITVEMGYSEGGCISYLMQSETMFRTTAALVKEVYDRLCMTVPTGPVADRTRRWAARNGCVPPLGWDDIDDPEEQPRRAIDRCGPGHGEVDPVVVTRILAGDWRLRATAAEKAAVIEQWDGTRNELARLTGWAIERYAGKAAS